MALGTPPLSPVRSTHSQANGEDNRDGTSDNRSWNCGAEGPTDDPAVLSLRARQSRAMLATLLLSFGIPMLLGGDEIGRTQQGNNNAYCQDNEITWFDWAPAPHGPAGIHSTARRVAPGAPGVPPQPVPGRRRSIRAALVHPGGQRDERSQLGRPEPVLGGKTASRHRPGAGNTHIGAMPRGFRAITMAIKARRPYKATKGRGEPWPRHPAPVK